MNENTNSTKSVDENLSSENQISEGSNSNNANENTNSKSVPLPTYLEERKKRQVIEAELAKLKEQKELEEQQKKIAEGKKDEVIQELQQKIQGLTKEFEPFIEKAKKYDEYDQSKRNKLKESLGDNWLSSFNTMPLIELEELASRFNPNVKLNDVDNGAKLKSKEKEYFTMEQLKALTQEELKDKEILAKANKSLAYHSKK